MAQETPPRFVHSADGDLKTVMTRRQWLVIILLSWVFGAYIWLVRFTSRIEVVHGHENVEAAARQKTFVACAWHQRLFISGIWLLSFQKTGSRIGALISPSREGECVARVAHISGAVSMRGSSSRTGRDALKAVCKAIRNDICPVMFADGPRGPAGEFKPGAVIASQITGVPMLPVGCDVTRFWQMKSWDSGNIPKPFTRFRIAVGALRQAERSDDADYVDRLSAEMGRELDRLTRIAETAG